MTLNLDSYNTASTVMHSAQGCALLVLALSEAYAVKKPGGKTGLAAPAAFLLSGAAMCLAMLHFLGGWDIKSALLSLELKSGFYIFVSFACFYASAGLSLLTFRSSGGKSLFWRYLFLVFLAAIGLLYFGMSGKVNPEAAAGVAAYHAAFGLTLLAAVFFKLLHELRPRRALNLAWIILLLISSFQLLSYREVPGAFDLGAVSLQASSQSVPPAAVPAAAPAARAVGNGGKKDAAASYSERAAH